MTREKINQLKMDLWEAEGHALALRAALTRTDNKVRRLRQELDSAEREWREATGRITHCRPAGFPRQPRTTQSHNIPPELLAQVKASPVFAMLSEAQQAKVLANIR
jgi:hypothetical protein